MGDNKYKNVKRNTLDEAEINQVPEFFRSPSDSQRIEVIGNANVDGTIIPIEKVIKTVVKMEEGPQQVTISHDIGSEADVIGRYKDTTNQRLDTRSGDWITLQDQTPGGLGGPNEVTIRAINRNTIILYFNFGVGVTGDIPLELYFLKRFF